MVGSPNLFDNKVDQFGFNYLILQFLHIYGYIFFMYLKLNNTDYQQNAMKNYVSLFFQLKQAAFRGLLVRII